MNGFTLKSRLLASSVFAGAAFGLVGMSAYAQEDVETVEAPAEDEARQETVFVTGSRIGRSDFTAESPVSVVTAEEINTAGNLSVADILREQIAVGSGGFNSSSNLSGAGAQSVDLRNLGPDRVLTLINGRRVAKFADALQNEAADLGFLPLAAIERIEVLRDGASAAYGADAVTGVVNVILKDDFEGFELTSQYGISDENDREQISFQAVMGANIDRGNVLVSAEYSFQDLVNQRDRDWAIPTVSGLFEGANRGFIINGSGAHPGGTTFFADDTQFCTLPRALGGDEITNVAGNGCPSDFFAVGSAFPDAPLAGNRYDYALQQSILGGQELINLTGYGTYDITDSVTAFLEMQVSDRESTSNLDGNPIFDGSGSPAFPGGWVIPGNNPYNPNPGVAAEFRVRPSSTVGIRAQTTDAQSFRIATGINGRLMDRIDYELSYIHTQVNANTTTNATFNLARAIRISDPELCADDPNCVAALAPGSLGALDVYRPGNWSESEIAYIRQIATSSFDQELNGLNAFASTELFELPAGAVGVAVGVEYREETLEFRPDAVTEAGESVANQTFSTDGGFDSYEAFVEVNVPLLKDQPFAESLNLNLQSRWFDYSTFGSDDVYKIGLNYTPVEDIRLRATYGTSFRVPTLVDTFSGGTVSFDFIDDPCDAGQIDDNPTRAANCLAAGPLGVPAGFTQSAPQLQVLAGGDLADGTFDLGPERGTTYTVGVVFNPRMVPGLRGSIDYWSIEVEDFIDTLNVEAEILDQCYDSPNLSDPACQLFSRSPNSRQLQGLVRTPLNREDSLETAGIDWGLDYTFDLADLMRSEGDSGVVTLSHQGTYLNDYNLFPGVGNYGNANGASAIPEYRLNFQAEYAINNIAAELRARYIPEIDDINFDGDNFLGYDVIEDHLEFDLRFTYDVRDNLRVLLGVNNVTGEDPPYVRNTGNNAAPGLYPSAVIGRYFFGRVTVDF